eukprot:g3947.t1
MPFPHISPSPSPSVSLRDISVAFNPGRRILNHINLDLYPGRVHFLVGPNGCGKSTLLRVMAGLHQPQSGTIKTVSPVGFVLQNPDHQVIMPTVASDVAFSLGANSSNSEEMENRVHSALQSVDMESFFNTPTSTLSGGQKQRIAIAGALVNHPKLLLLDELTTFVDEEDQLRIVQCVRNVVDSGNDVTAVWVTHRFEEFSYADSVSYMEQGVIKCGGKPKKVMEYIRGLGAKV